MGYAREARASYLDFVAARERGELPEGIRFQVCLPTPFAVVSSVVVEDALAPVEAAYERAMLAEVAALCRHIPHRDLCIQWDLCNEMVIWDGQKTSAVPYPEVPRAALLARMARICAVVPDDVELGLHLCYGDFAGHHFVEPKDASAMVDFANALARTIRHKLAYIHMPVPIERTDDAFHRPFARARARRWDRALSRRGACEGWRRGRAGAHRRRRPLRPPLRHRDRMRHGACPQEATVRSLLSIHAEVCGGK